MTSQTLSLPQANLKISLWQVDADSINSSELYVWLNNLGLPSEASMRLRELDTYTKRLRDKIIPVGKIILLKIIEFVKAHPNLSKGIAIGAAVGFLVNSIPFIGPLLAPLAGALGIVVFGIAGHRLDKSTRGKGIQNGILGIAQDVIEITSDFFKLVVEVFNAVFNQVITA